MQRGNERSCEATSVVCSVVDLCRMSYFLVYSPFQAFDRQTATCMIQVWPDQEKERVFEVGGNRIVWSPYRIVVVLVVVVLLFCDSWR